MKKTAVYPGSFDPVTNGHIDVIERASLMFDKVIVLVAINSKKRCLFSIEERKFLVQESLKYLKNVEADFTDKLAVEYAASVGAIAIIRGVRAVSDFDYEFQLALMNRKLDPKITTVFLLPKENYVYLNSSIVKEIARYGGDVSAFVPKIVEEKLKEKFRG